MSKQIAILRSEGDLSNTHWRAYMVVTAEQTVHVRMQPALLMGWNVSSIAGEPTCDGWDTMSVDAIVAWKERNHDVDLVQDETERAWVLDILQRHGFNPNRKASK